MLTFEEETHTYRWKGKVVPSVTQILKPVSTDFSMVDEDVMDAASDRGRGVHKAVQLYEEGRLDFSSLTPFVSDCLYQWMLFCDAHNVKVIKCEGMVYSELGYAGTYDVLAEVGDKRDQYLIDVKTSSTVPRSVGPQTAAYTEAMGITAGTTRAVLHLRPDMYRFAKLLSSRDRHVFNACLQIHKFNSGN